MKIKILILLPLSVVFLGFGVFMLITSYYQNNPAVFLALFFSSSLITLLSLTCLLGLVWRLVLIIKKTDTETDLSMEENQAEGK